MLVAAHFPMSLILCEPGCLLTYFVANYSSTQPTERTKFDAKMAPAPRLEVGIALRKDVLKGLLLDATGRTGMYLDLCV
ncbi:hypothetical protein F5B21DRAFT_462885, partial [Xylaria acuta]